VTSGDAEIGLTQLSEIADSPAVDLAGALPAEVQNTTVLTAVMPPNARDAAAAKALVDFLTSAKAQAVHRARGLEPG
jgi:molybdate transport system substrate-binding protein